MSKAELDYLRAYESAVPAERARAQDIMKYGVIAVEGKTPIYKAIAKLVEKRITGLPVVDVYKGLVGVITEKDVLKLLYETHRGAGIVEDFMTRDVIRFQPKVRAIIPAIELWPKEIKLHL